MSTLYAVRGADLKIIVRADTPDAAGDAFWRETERRGQPAVHSWIVEASSLTPELLAECEHVVEVEEARDLVARWVWWRTGGPDGLPKPKTTDQLHANVKRMTKMCVTTEDQDRLYAWVSAKMVERVANHPMPHLISRAWLATAVGQSLDLDCGGLRWQLCESAGWPS